MSFLGFNSLLGLQNGNEGGAGLNYNAQGTPINWGTTPGQINTSYDQTQGGLAQQQAFLQALQAQGGLNNQSAVFAQQQQLANQLQGMANGNGPNPALNQLAETTGQNVDQTAALMASQRGVSSNPGLIARQAATQGAQIQQHAAQQAATLRAQQQLAAVNALQNQQGALANLATTQVGQQAAGTTGYNQALQSEQASLLGALNNQNNSNVNMQSNINNANAGISSIAAKGQQGIVGGLFGGAGSQLMTNGGGSQAAGAAAAGANGGEVKRNYANGGPVSLAGKYLYSSAPNLNAPAPSNSTAAPLENGTSDLNTGSNKLGAGLGSQLKGLKGSDEKAGTVTVSDLPDMNRQAMEPEYARGGNVKKPVVGEQLAARGQMVPGKAKVRGNSYANDTVDAKLSPGEVVIPRSVMQSKDPARGAAQFVQAILAKQHMKSKKAAR